MNYYQKYFTKSHRKKYSQGKKFFCFVLFVDKSRVSRHYFLVVIVGCGCFFQHKMWVYSGVKEICNLGQKSYGKTIGKSGGGGGVGPERDLSFFKEKIGKAAIN